jgi:hypothetical protein
MFGTDDVSVPRQMSPHDNCFMEHVKPLNIAYIPFSFKGKLSRKYLNVRKFWFPLLSKCSHPWSTRSQLKALVKQKQTNLPSFWSEVANNPWNNRRSKRSPSSSGRSKAL